MTNPDYYKTVLKTVNRRFNAQIARLRDAGHDAFADALVSGSRSYRQNALNALIAYERKQTEPNRTALKVALRRLETLSDGIDLIP